MELESFSELKSERESMYSKPMVSIGIYISVAALCCILAMALDLLYGIKNKKLWFPTKYFSLNAASITVITVAMKLPVDLSSSMPGMVDQVAKFGGMAFMCTMISNLMPSLASMDNNSLLANTTGLSILVITLVGNIFIQIRTHVINPNMFNMHYLKVIVTYFYMGMLLFLLAILISSAVTILSTKKILEFKYQAKSRTILNDQHIQEKQICTFEELRELVKRYWIMAESSSPQFMVASNPLASASGIICAISVVMYASFVWELFLRRHYQSYESVYKGSMTLIVITQSIGIVVGSIAPIFRCFTVLSFKSFANQNKKHFMVFKVEKYWTQKLYEWKENGISFFSSGHTSRYLLHNMKNCLLSFCIGFQKVIVVLCKLAGLVPIVVIIFVIYCSCYLKSVKAMLFTLPSVSNNDDRNQDLSNYVLLLEDDTRLAAKTLKGISDSMNRLIQNAQKKQHNNLLNLLQTSIAFDGVGTFDNDQIQSLLPVELVNSWSLPIVSLTCIAISLPNINKNIADNLFKSVHEGLLYTLLVEEHLNRASVYANIRRASVIVWHDVEYKCKWLENTLERNAYEGKTTIEIIKRFDDIAEEIMNKFSRSTTPKQVEIENLPPNVIVANSMYRITQSIMLMYKRNNIEITEDELFTRLSHMIADILAACLTNIPRVIIKRCHESAIEKREASVVAAIDLLGRTTKIIKLLETRGLPNMDPDKMGLIDEWRLHLKQP